MTNVVIGGGVGGLAAALSWRRRGLPVTLLEAREIVGGLASSFEVDGRAHDHGPYILLDLPGLEWAFERLGLNVRDELDLIALPEVYRVVRDDASAVAIRTSLDETCDGLQRDFPGSADAYRAFVADVSARYARLAPLQRAPFAGPASLLSGGRWRDVPFLLRSLGGVLGASGLPEPVKDALGIWTHVAGQPMAAAPAPMALVPAVIHGVGAFTVRGGMGRLPEALLRAAVAAGVDVRTNARVDRVVLDGVHAVAVEVGGDRIPVDRVCADAPAIDVLTRLLAPARPEFAPYADLPLQSPGVAAWWEGDASPDTPFLTFRLDRDGVVGRLVPGAVDPDRRGIGRVFAPVDHGWAESVGEDGQRARLESMVQARWWRDGVADLRVVHTRIPAEWGRKMHLYRDSMNPVMSAAFMRKGRMPHFPPGLANLSLCGSATHPGQWVSFCAISGVLATAR